ncbi:MAG: hypothetical protein E3J73_01635 [Candidatus Bathyarchaeum sp.]|nr:MAG: hypothetical protein E3J73_01635 [Candidatus Bathyarchaeum sp.]
MKNSYNKGLRRRLISVVILPIISLFWMIGWILSYVGSQKTLQIDISKQQLIFQKIILKDKSEQEAVQQEILA